ncbi:MAG: protein kinase [Myxococcales bacterium]|nr:protein kinase [Myxococcales bacterium]MBL0192775.1 protein kinase [Myxococcales bacterium]
MPLSFDEAQRSPVSSGDIIAGKYRVDRVLGAGGMGVVVAATHTDLGQRVALKFVLPHMLGGQSVERFFREARSTAQLKSEHITRVHDVGRLDSGAPYIVMELLEGTDLSVLRKRAGEPLAVPDAVEFVLQACEGLVEAHAAGIVHRDLKPQNLFVARKMNGAPLVKILDFGISKATGAAAVGQMNLTDSATVLGSPLYMSPEQMRSARSVDARSDIWALGVILYELLAGKVPFDGETVTELCLKVVIEKESPLAEHRPELPAGLAEIVHRCLAKDPNERFANVAALADALDPFSRSAEKGAPHRSWRSFSDTADASGPSELSTARNAAVALADSGGGASAIASAQRGEDKSSTQSTWGNTQSGRRARTRTFAWAFGGVVAAGLLLLAGVHLGGRTSPPIVASPAASQPTLASAAATTRSSGQAGQAAGPSETAQPTVPLVALSALPVASAAPSQTARKPPPTPAPSATAHATTPSASAPRVPPTASGKVNGSPILH